MKFGSTFARIIAAVGIVALTASPVFAQTTASVGGSASTGGWGHFGSTLLSELRATFKQERQTLFGEQQQELVNAKATIAAHVTAQEQVDATCLMPALSVREDAIAAAFGTFGTSVNTALATRKAALLAAWGQTDVQARKDGITAAWTAYDQAFKAAHATLNNTRNAAWATFRNARIACGVPASATDSSSASVDGQL